MPDLPLATPQFLLDDTWIAGQRRVVRRWLPAVVYPDPVIVPDRPWEGRILAFYGTVLPDPEGGFRLYYSDFVPGEANQAHSPGKLFMARSDDGFRWEKPDLGVVDWRGSTANNIVLDSGRHFDSPSVIHDPADPAWPWKLLVFEMDTMVPAWGPDWGLYVYRSRDGLRWEKVPGPSLKAGDRTNLMAERVDGACVAYTRHWQMWKHTGTRSIWRIESPDALAWTPPELVLAPDLHDAPDIEFYGMSVFRRHGWFFGLLESWDSLADVIETHLVFSRDGKRWERPFPRAPFIAATYSWNRTWSSCASNGPLYLGDQMVFHFGGRWVSHHYDAAQQQGVIGYASLAADRFCAIEGESGGWFDTPPFVWPGGDLAVNVDTRESFRSHPAKLTGELAVEVLTPDGELLPGWSAEQRALCRANTHCRCQSLPAVVRWPADRSLAQLADTRLRLRFFLRHARLFSFAASP